MASPRALVAAPRALGWLLLLLSLAPGLQAQGRLVRLDPGDERDPAFRDEEALRAVFRSAYQRRFDGVDLMARDPESLEGAFFVFQKAMVLLSAEPEALERALAGQGVRTFLRPGMRGAGQVAPSLQGLVPEGGTPPRIYAPSYESLDRIRDLAARIRQAETQGDRDELPALEAELMGVLRREIGGMSKAAELSASGESIFGLGTRDDGAGPVPLTLDPDRLALRAAQIGTSDPTEAAALDTGGSPGGEPPPRASSSGAGAAQGSSRSMTPAAEQFYDETAGRFNQPMSHAERWRFEMGLQNFGFELSSPEDPREGVPAYTPIRGDPGEVFFGGASGLRRSARSR